MPDTTAPLPDGTWFRWGGRAYPGAVESPTTVTLLSGTPEPGFTENELGGGFLRQVPTAEVEGFRLVTTCRWRDRTFTLLARTGDEVVLGYRGMDQREAESLGAVQVERGVFTLTVPAAEVTDVGQERTVFLPPS